MAGARSRKADELEGARALGLELRGLAEGKDQEDARGLAVYCDTALNQIATGARERSPLMRLLAPAAGRRDEGLSRLRRGDDPLRQHLPLLRLRVRAAALGQVEDLGDRPHPLVGARRRRVPRRTAAISACQRAFTSVGRHRPLRSASKSSHSRYPMSWPVSVRNSE